MNPNLMGKVVELIVNGVSLDIQEDAEFTKDGYERTEEKGATKMGFHRSRVPAQVKASVKLKSGLSLGDLAAWEDLAVTVRLDSGQAYTMNNAWNKIAPVAKGGVVPVELIADRAQEVR